MFGLTSYARWKSVLDTIFARRMGALIYRRLTSLDLWKSDGSGHALFAPGPRWAMPESCAKLVLDQRPFKSVLLLLSEAFGLRKEAAGRWSGQDKGISRIRSW